MITKIVALLFTSSSAIKVQQTATLLASTDDTSNLFTLEYGKCYDSKGYGDSGRHNISWTSKTEAKCKSECALDDSCLAFEFQYLKNECFLMNEDPRSIYSGTDVERHVCCFVKNQQVEPAQTIPEPAQIIPPTITTTNSTCVSTSYTKEDGECCDSNGYDDLGLHIFSYTAKTDDDCKSECTLDDSCVAFEYYYILDENACVLMKEDPEFTYTGNGKRGISCFLKTCVTNEEDEPAQTSLPATPTDSNDISTSYTKEDGECCNSNGYDNLGLHNFSFAKTEDDCRSECTLDDSCVAFEFYFMLDDNACLLMKEDPEYTYTGNGKRGVSCFLKDQTE